MHQYLKRNHFIFLICLLLPLASGCDVTRNDTSISNFLINNIDSSNENKANTSLLLLSHLALTSVDVKKLTTIYKNEKEPIKKLFIAYVLYQRTQEQKYVDDFIVLYPTGKDQKQIWYTSRNKTRYVNASSPLQEQLAVFAIYNTKALKKLLSGYKFADGADADSMSRQLYYIYKFNPVEVKKEMQKRDIDLSEIGID